MHGLVNGSVHGYMVLGDVVGVGKCMGILPGLVRLDLFIVRGLV